MYDRITRDEAINQVGLEAVESVESEHADFTGRLTDSTTTGMTEFCASVELDGGRRLMIYILVDSDEVMAVDDLSQIDWVGAAASAEFLVVE